MSIQALCVCVYGSGAPGGSSYIAAHDRRYGGRRHCQRQSAKAASDHSDVAVHVLAERHTVLAPMSRIHCHLVRPSLETKTQRVKCPMCYRTTWPGRDRTPAVANSNRRRDPRPGARQATYPPASSNEQDGSATLRAPLRIAHHPPTHLCVGPANAARTSAMPDPHHQLAGGAGTGAESRGRGREEEGQEKGLDSTIMPA